MMDTIVNLDIAITLYINGLNSTSADYLMYYISNKYIWIPLYLVILYLIKKKTGNQFWLVFSAFILLIGITDQVCTHLFKETFQRLRPCHTPEIKNIIHTFNGHCGGKYGFVSAHAANSFAFAIFAGNFLKSKTIAGVLLIWAITVAYSRVYLGVHFFGDIFVGALVGIIIALLINTSYLFLIKYFYKI